MQPNLNHYANLAHNILNTDSRYKENKSIITSLFNKNRSEGAIEYIIYRLTLIDSYYSTQMSKRLYGIEQLAEALANYSDTTLVTQAQLFLDNPTENTVIAGLLAKNYGIDKTGKPFGKAISLISKYLYFLTHYQFPIYDNLAFIAYPLIAEQKLQERNYFNAIRTLNQESQINDYEKLDNLLWLLGKITNGSFSILMDAEKYLQIVQTKEIINAFDTLINNNTIKDKSKEKDNIIRNYIQRNYQDSTIFNPIEKEFFKFAFGL